MHVHELREYVLPTTPGYQIPAPHELREYVLPTTPGYQIPAPSSVRAHMCSYQVFAWHVVGLWVKISQDLI